MPTAWNKYDKHPDWLVLENNDLTAKKPSSVASHPGVRANSEQNAGKLYFEVHVGGSIGAGASTGISIGVATSAQSLSTMVGVSTTGWGYEEDGGMYYNNGNVAGDFFKEQDIIGVAVDIDAGHIWWAKNGTWQNGGDPANGTNPVYSNLTGLALRPMVSISGTNTTANGRFTAASQSYAAPAGFGQWPETITPTARRPAPEVLRWNQQAAAGASEVKAPDNEFGQPINKDMEFGGTASFSGTVTVNGTPAIRRVAIFDRANRLLVAGGWSGADGTFTFNNLRADLTYFVVAFDYLGQANAVIYDHITPV